MEINTRPLLEEILQELKRQKVFTKEILSFAEACEYINRSSSFLYKMTSERKIAHYIPNGKMIYFKRSELDSWLTRNRLSSDVEIQKDSIKHLSGK